MLVKKGVLDMHKRRKCSTIAMVVIFSRLVQIKDIVVVVIVL